MKRLHSLVVSRGFVPSIIFIGALALYWLPADKSQYAIVVFTYVLAISTTLLWLSTAALQQATDQQMRASERASKTAVTVEMPLVYLHSMKLDPDLTDISSPPSRGAIFNFENFGRNPAIVQEIALSWHVGISLPELPEYMPPKKHAAAIRPSSDVVSVQHDEIRIPISEHEKRSIIEDRSSLWVFGYLEYEDFLSRTHRLGFCGRWYLNGTKGAFGQKECPPDYSYRLIDGRPIQEYV